MALTAHQQDILDRLKASVAASERRRESEALEAYRQSEIRLAAAFGELVAAQARYEAAVEAERTAWVAVIGGRE